MLCITSGGAVAKLAVTVFTIAWTHSVEQVRWEEDIRIENGQLVVLEARIKGSGAGMEVPEGAVLEGGFWHYRPNLPPLPELELASSDVVPDWQLCIDRQCRPLSEHLPDIDGSHVLSACTE